MLARSLVRMAIEWCGIMAFIHATSATVAWLRSSQRAAAKTTAATPRMARFMRLSSYMPSMKSSMTTAIAAPM